MTKTTKSAAATAPAAPIDTPANPLETVTLRDEFAMRIAASVAGAIIQRGGVAAVASAYRDDQLMETAYFYADMALRVRAKS